MRALTVAFLFLTSAVANAGHVEIRIAGTLVESPDFSIERDFSAVYAIQATDLQITEDEFGCVGLAEWTGEILSASVSIDGVSTDPGTGARGQAPQAAAPRSGCQTGTFFSVMGLGNLLVSYDQSGGLDASDLLMSDNPLFSLLSNNPVGIFGITWFGSGPRLEARSQPTTFEFVEVVSVPEPAPFLLILFGLALVVRQSVSVR